MLNKKESKKSKNRKKMKIKKRKNVPGNAK